MKKFTKLALATSVAFSANAMAMQALDDASLSATTGQDGLSIGIGISKIEIEKLFIHDNDGLKGGYKDVTSGTSVDKTAGAGAIVIYGNSIGAVAAGTDDAGNPTAAKPAHRNEKHGVVIAANYDNNGAYLLQSRNLADLKIDSDAGNGNPFINVAAQVSGLDISIGKIGVTASGALPTDASNSIRRGGGTVINEILSGLEIKTGQLNANIQLGAAPQGAMIKLDTIMLGGLEIKNLGIVDNSTKSYEFTKVDVPKRDPATGVIVRDAQGNIEYAATDVPVTTREAGEIFIESIKIADADKKDLTLKQNISVYNDAYVGPTGNTVGKAAHVRIVSLDTGAKDQYIKGIHLGSRNAASIGDMEVQGLQTYWSPSVGVYNKGAVITISGH